mmetsp:Transcript_43198/g.103724  ORF Transcript_43198/g.103724 Transcript_43198/m.103724 type:complete len:357 (-) Transcript_43198:102-1172(-)
MCALGLGRSHHRPLGRHRHGLVAPASLLVVVFQGRQRLVEVVEGVLRRGPDLLADHARAKRVLQHLLEGEAVVRLAFEERAHHVERVRRELLPSWVAEGEVGRVNAAEELVLLLGRVEGEAAAEHDVEAHAQRPRVALHAVHGRRLAQLPLLVPKPDDHLGRTVLRGAVHACHALLLRPLLDRRRAVQVSQPHGPLRTRPWLPHLHALRLDIAKHDAGRVSGLHREHKPCEDLARVLLPYSASLVDQREQVRARAALRRRELADDKRPLGTTQHLVKPREAAQVVVLCRRVVELALRHECIAQFAELPLRQVVVLIHPHRIVHSRLLMDDQEAARLRALCDRPLFLVETRECGVLL